MRRHVIVCIAAIAYCFGCWVSASQMFESAPPSSIAAVVGEEVEVCFGRTSGYSTKSQEISYTLAMTFKHMNEATDVDNRRDGWVLYTTLMENPISTIGYLRTGQTRVFGSFDNEFFGEGNAKYIRMEFFERVGDEGKTRDMGAIVVSIDDWRDG